MFMNRSEEQYEDELIDAFDLEYGSEERPVTTAVAQIPQCSQKVKQNGPYVPKDSTRNTHRHDGQASGSLYPSFHDLPAQKSTGDQLPPSKTSSSTREQPPNHVETHTEPQPAPPPSETHPTPDMIEAAINAPSTAEIEEQQKEVELSMEEYAKRMDYVAQALAGNTPHQIAERAKREQRRLERQGQREEKRMEVMHTRERLFHEREERRHERTDRVHRDDHKD